MTDNKFINQSIDPYTDNPSETKNKRIIEYDNATDWENGLDRLYIEDEIISILNIVSCIENKRRGFGNKNDDKCYCEEREANKNNILYEEAIYGLKLLEKGRLKNSKKK